MLWLCVFFSHRKLFESLSAASLYRTTKQDASCGHDTSNVNTICFNLIFTILDFIIRVPQLTIPFIDIQYAGCLSHEPSLMALAPRVSYSAAVELTKAEGHSFDSSWEKSDACIIDLKKFTSSNLLSLACCQGDGDFKVSGKLGKWKTKCNCNFRKMKRDG